MTIKIGILREGKNPPDKRTPLLPEQCLALMNLYPQCEFIIQKSPIRCVKDEEYLEKGLKVQENLNECDILFGVKEVPIEMLMPNRTYFFFSHTIKKQAYNQKLLQNILKKNIRLIDYECLTDENNNRVVAFGRFAGIVGAYNALRSWGMRYQTFDLKPAHQCKNYKEVCQQLSKIKLPNIKIALTGTGRVGKGALEILEKANLKRVSKQDFLNKKFNEPVFVVLQSLDYYDIKTEHKNLQVDFYKNPEFFESKFLQYASETDLLITAHFWHTKAEPLFTKRDILDKNFKIKVIADITCDINGSIPCTLRPSTIAEPVYDYNPFQQCIEKAFSSKENISIMAIDNLPGELPYDASETFGNQLIQYVFPALLGKANNLILERATIAKNGFLGKNFEYLKDYAQQDQDISLV
jgi:alanine dehydrogenase